MSQTAPHRDFFEVTNTDHLVDLCGEHDQHLALVEERLGLTLYPKGNRIYIEGEAKADVDRCKEIFAGLAGQLAAGRGLTAGDVGRAVSFIAKGAMFEVGKAKIYPRTSAQEAYLNTLRTSDMVFGLGPAGTGKTFLAVAVGMDMLLAGEVRRLILSRPAVEAGERLGFLPGDLREKVDPYLRPLYDSMERLLPAKVVERRIETNEIEVAPLAYMRGRTLDDAYAILDEGQNATSMQMKMFLTRMGENSRMVITGDPSQVDLPADVPSGLRVAERILEGVSGISFFRFSEDDVVRHALVSRIVKAYARADAAGATSAAKAGKSDGGSDRQGPAR
ncbi:MAG: PhoH family protein [Pseudomonadota bacterium]